MKTDTMDGMMDDFDLDEDANFDEMDRIEQKMERIEMDMDKLMSHQIKNKSQGTLHLPQPHLYGLNITEKDGIIPNEETNRLLTNNMKVEENKLAPIILHREMIRD